jgi:hypothetical protein
VDNERITFLISLGHTMGQFSGQFFPHTLPENYTGVIPTSHTAEEAILGNDISKLVNYPEFRGDNY